MEPSRIRRVFAIPTAPVVLVFIVSRFVILFLVIITYALHIPPPIDPYHGEPGLINPFTAFDSEHYIAIATSGYTHLYQFAFFPLYSLLMATLHHITGLSVAWAGVIISNVSVLITLALLVKLLPNPARNPGLWLFALNPIAMFETAVYTEALFVALCLSTWYSYKKQHYVLSGILLALAINTRNLGAILVVPILVDWWAHRHEPGALRMFWQGGIPVILLGLLYPFYQLITQGNAFLFITVESQFWNRHLTFPLYTLWLDCVRFIHVNYAYKVEIVINFISIGFVTYLCKIFWKTQKPLVLFLLVTTIIPLLDAMGLTFEPASVSLFRYIYASFPIYLLAPLDSESKWFRNFRLIVLSLMMIITIFFVSKWLF